MLKKIKAAIFRMSKKRIAVLSVISVLLVSLVATCAIFSDRIEAQMSLMIAKFQGDPVLMSWSDQVNANGEWLNTAGDFHAFRDTITTATFLDSYDGSVRMTQGPWDVSANQDESVMAYIDGTDLYIASNVVETAKVIANPDSAYLFLSFPKLTEVNGGDKLDTGIAMTMASMFKGCQSLESLDVSIWDTSKVNDLNQTFSGCKSLTELDIADWETGDVRDMYGLFSGLNTVKKLDVSKWDTGKVTDMGNMFQNCKSLTALNVSSFHTTKVTNMQSMFQGCEKLTSLDVSNFHTGAITGNSKLSSFASGCISLTDIKLGSNFGQSGKIPSPGSGNGMFYVSSVTPTKVSGANAVMMDYGWDSDNRGFAVTVESVSGGTLTATPQLAINGKTINLTAVPNDKYEGATVSYNDGSGNKTIDLSAGEKSFVMPAANVKITPKWAPSDIKVTYNANGGAFNGGATNVVTYGKGDVVKTVKTSNVSEDGSSHSGGYGNNKSETKTVTIPGAESLEVTITYATEHTNYDWVSIYDGSVTPSASNFDSSISGKLGGTTKTTQTFTIPGDTAQFYFRSDTSVDEYFGYYAEVKGNSMTEVSGAYQEPANGSSYMIFDGWYTDAACTPGNEFDLSKLTADTTVYAKWKDGRFTVTYNANGGSFGAASTNAVVYAPGASTPSVVSGTYKEPVNAETYKVFDGWYTNAACTSGYEFELGSTTMNTTVYAKWKDTRFTVTYNANGGSFGAASTNAVVYAPGASTPSVVSGTYKEPTHNANNMVFDGWYTDQSGNYKFDLSATTSSITVYAKWKEIEILEPVMQSWSWSATTDFHAYQSTVTSVTFLDTYNPSVTMTQGPWDVSAAKNGSVMAYMNGTNVYIASNVGEKANVIANQNSSYLFYRFGQMTAVKNINLLDTSRATNMGSMFSGCKALTSLDVSGFDTSKVTDMGGMFESTGITSINVSGFDTTKVTNMRLMFASTLLTSLDVSNFDTNAISSPIELSGFAHNSLDLRTITLGANFGQSKNIDNSYAGLYEGNNLIYGYFCNADPYGPVSTLYTTVRGANSVIRSYPWSSDYRSVSFVSPTAAAIDTDYVTDSGEDSAIHDTDSTEQFHTAQ